MKKVTIVSLLLLSSCTWIEPHPLFMATDVPGSPEYKRGWQDGCHSGLATYGTAVNKMFNSFYQDYNMMKNADYNAAWHESFDYCRHYNYKWQTNDYYQGIMY